MIYLTLIGILGLQVPEKGQKKKVDYGPKKKKEQKRHKSEGIMWFTFWENNLSIYVKTYWSNVTWDRGFERDMFRLQS